MSGKSARKTKELSAPREESVILEEAAKVYMAAGGLQYEIAIKSEELKTLNERARILNNEVHARRQLDAVKNAAALKETASVSLAHPQAATNG